APLPDNTANFHYRTLYDYTEDGNVSFMQFVLNRNMMNLPSVAIDYRYQIKKGKKTGWQEININEKDTSYGTIEWLDDFHLYERKYNRLNRLVYEINTELDSLSFVEKDAVIKQYSDTILIQNQRIQNITQDGEPVQLIYHELLDGSVDTIYIEVLSRDQYGNATDLIERSAVNGDKTFIRKVFEYYGE
ncbi:MAG: hypothetical protein LPK45_11350, partial [Bacteroidota bacterium]|nr:hypothetical protein [Bacteroidota bacterium]MDX5431702.1 hypothetical protein [Bacteroidota bacterium]MDX5470417.1 hypothetical protein [Bacteroidota bacterium]